MIPRVVELALRGAVRGLPARAVGVRCHCLPVEEALDDCLAGVAALLLSPGFSGTHVVIGTSRQPLGPIPANVQIFTAHVAAAEATRLRNDIEAAQQAGFFLIYLSSGSTPGEAGLDVMLKEIDGAQVARHFAEGANLELLAELARSQSRLLRSRLEDTSVEKLGRYASRADSSGGELVALPVLGLIPSSLNRARERPNAGWTQTFDSLSNLKTLHPPEDFQKAVAALGEPARRAFAQELERQKLVPEGVEPHAFALDLARATFRFGAGLDTAPENLCGLTRGLLRYLQRPEALARLLQEERDPPDVQDEPSDDPVDPLPMSEAEMLAQRGQAGLVGRVELHVERGEVAATVYDGEVVRATLDGAIVSPVLSRAFERRAEIWSKGGALEVTPAHALTNQTREDAEFDERFLLRTSGDPLERAFDQAIASFHAARTGLIAKVATTISNSSDLQLSEDQLALLYLEALPLTATANAKPEVEAYLRAYEALVAVVFGATDQVTPQTHTDLLTHLDVAFACDSQRHATVARLLPLHPLRLSRCVTWLSSEEEPPVFPSTLALHTGLVTDLLHPQGDPWSFHLRSEQGPASTSLARAGKQGLSVLWDLLSARGLLSAIDIELVDVVSPAGLVKALLEEALTRFESDASSGDGVHLRVFFAYSGRRRAADTACITEAELPELAHIWSSLRGDGVTMELVGQPREAGKNDVHLSVDGVQTPFLMFKRLAVAAGPWQVDYVPGRSGNIMAVELRGNTCLDAYRRILHERNADASRGFDPARESAPVAPALVKTLAARGGWPIPPSSSEPLAAYDTCGGDVIVTLVDPEVFDGGVAQRLTALSPGVSGPSSQGIDLQAIREGMLSLPPCRKFIAKLMAGEDQRHLLGWLGLLRAFRSASARSPDITTLAVSLDGEEGAAWTRTMERVFKQDRSRADLLLVDASLQTKEITAMRVIELKARTSALALRSESTLARLAHQALQTRSQVCAVLGPEGLEHRSSREALRRLLWMGAGSQRAAFKWREILGKFDAVLAGEVSALPFIGSECWLVPEGEWSGPDEFTRDLAGPAVGGFGGGSTPVLFRVLAANAPSSPSDGSPSREVPSSRRPNDAEPSPQHARAMSLTTAPGHDAAAQPPGLQVSMPSRASAPNDVPTPSANASVDTASRPPEAVQPEPPRTLVGTAADSTRWVVLGRLSANQEPVALDLDHPKTIGIFGFMGSGKSYLLGTLIEASVEPLPGLNRLQVPLATVVFNYRRNANDRFELASLAQPNPSPDDIRRLREQFGAEPKGLRDVHMLCLPGELRPERRREYQGLGATELFFDPKTLSAEDWELLMGEPGSEAVFARTIRNTLVDLRAAGDIDFDGFEQAVDGRLTGQARSAARLRFDFVRRYLSAERGVDFEQLLKPGRVLVVDLRQPLFNKEDALRFFLVCANQISKVQGRFNKMLVFDEAHEYMTDAFGERMQARIRLMRHEGTTYVFASQDVQSIPVEISRFLTTRFVFDLGTRENVEDLEQVAPEFRGHRLMGMRPGHCLVQANVSSDGLVIRPKEMHVRPRATQHGGASQIFTAK